MKKEAYEKQIALLEERLDFANSRVEELKSSTTAKINAALGSREKLYKDLLMFMQDLYSRLGSIQNDLLSHMSTIGDQLSQTNKAKISTKIVMLNELMSLCGSAPAPKMFEEIEE